MSSPGSSRARLGRLVGHPEGRLRPADDLGGAGCVLGAHGSDLRPLAPRARAVVRLRQACGQVLRGGARGCLLGDNARLSPRPW